MLIIVPALMMTLLPVMKFLLNYLTIDSMVPWTEEPGGLQSMASLTVGHD